MSSLATYFPAGSAPIGYDTPQPGPVTPVGGMCDDVDPVTGEIRSLVGTLHPADAAVVHYARARYHSGVALAEQGNRFHEFRKATEQFTDQAKQEVVRGLAPLVQRGWIRIAVNTSELNGDSGATLIRYENLHAGNGNTETARIL